MLKGSIEVGMASGNVWVDQARFRQDLRHIRSSNANASAIERTRSCFHGYGMLNVYKYNATMEVKEVTNADMWDEVYPELEPVTRHKGVHSVIHDNTVISMRPAFGTEYEPNMDVRTPNPAHRGSLWSVFTPQSQAGGHVRSLAPRVFLRMTTPENLVIAAAVMEH